MAREACSITLTVGDRIYSGWKSVDALRSIETISGGFNIDLTERWDGQAIRWPIKAGDLCVLAFNDITVISGYVDEAEHGFDATTHKVRVAGRDRTADLVDCSAVHAPDEWKGLSLEALCTILAKPFGIRVTAAVDTGEPFATFKLEQGETAFDAIDRACRLRGVKPISDGNGGLLLTRPGEARATTSLVEGENLLSMTGRFSWKDRYSEYIVKGQAAGGDDADDEKAAFVKGSAKDAGVSRYRPKMIIDQVDNMSAEERAQFEATTQAARALKFDGVVQGHYQQDGSLWPINALVAVRAPTLDVDETLLIVSTRFKYANDASRTEINLTRPDAFKPAPVVAKGKKDKGHGLPPGTEIVTADGGKR